MSDLFAALWDLQTATCNILHVVCSEMMCCLCCRQPCKVSVNSSEIRKPVWIRSCCWVQGLHNIHQAEVRKPWRVVCCCMLQEACSRQMLLTDIHIPQQSLSTCLKIISAVVPRQQQSLQLLWSHLRAARAMWAHPSCPTRTCLTSWQHLQT